VQAARDEEENRRDREHYAARAAMPAALAEIVRYATATLRILKPMRPPAGQEQIQYGADWSAPTLPVVPSQSLGVLQTCMQSADPTRNTRQEIATLFEELQIMDSRVRTLMEEVRLESTTVVTRQNLHEQIMDAIELYIRCNQMFEYARRRTEEMSI